MGFTSSQLFAASLLSITVYVLLRRKQRRPFPYPPGPKSLPLIGNLRDVPFKYQWFTYEKWGREIGSDIVHAELLGIHVVVLNSEKAATDLLEKRSSIYSDRCSCLLDASPPDSSPNAYQTSTKGYDRIVRSSNTVSGLFPLTSVDSMQEIGWSLYSRTAASGGRGTRHSMPTCSQPSLVNITRSS